MKLTLTYDCQYGFKELYMTETECEFDVSSRLLDVDFTVLQNMPRDPEMKKDFIEDLYLFSEHLKDIYEKYKTNPMNMFAEENEDDYIFDGEIDCLESCILEDAYHNIFKKLVGEFPGYFRMYNCRLELDESEEESCLNFADGKKLYLKDILELRTKALSEVANTVTITLDLENCPKEEAISALHEVKNIINSGKQPINKRITVEKREVDSATACAMLNISRQTLANWVKAGKLTRNASGKYDLEKINKLLKK